MADNVGRRITVLLLIAAILWFLYDNFGLSPILKVTVTSEESEVETSNLRITKKIDERPLKISVGSFNRSFTNNYASIDIENVDSVPGNVTVILYCMYSSNTEDKTEYILSGKTKRFEFYNLGNDCEQYDVKPADVIVET
ncbi:MAG: hypothetical protein U9O94_09455 [Nanoarchaeota archaeon]|nr:hypothetical protein [Nanoarchaeota archaeon]